MRSRACLTILNLQHWNACKAALLWKIYVFILQAHKSSCYTGIKYVPESDQCAIDKGFKKIQKPDKSGCYFYYRFQSLNQFFWVKAPYFQGKDSLMGQPLFPACHCHCDKWWGTLCALSCHPNLLASFFSVKAALEDRVHVLFVLTSPQAGIYQIISMLNKWTKGN